jgi:putative redox protein
MAKATARIQKDPYRTEIESASANVLVADEPLSAGGKDVGFAPKELLAAALSSCTAITLRMYVEKKGWETGEITVETTLEEEEGKCVFVRKLTFEAPLEEEQKARLTAIADACPVHKILAGTIDFKTTVS